MSVQNASVRELLNALPKSTVRPAIPPRGPSTSPTSSGLRSRLAAHLSGGSLGLTTPLTPPAPARARRDPLLLLMQRITQGFHPFEYERARGMGYQAWLEEQLAPAGLDDSALETRLGHFTGLTMSPKELFETYANDPTRPYLELKIATLARAIESKRQLEQRMVEFWNDHFSIFHDKDLEWMLLPEFDRTVIRPHALGSFPAMLRASAYSGAMLFYLDNWLNVRGAAQENYGREVLELHTLGVDGGYSEADVREVAKCLTGWTLELRQDSPDFMRGKFDSRLHEPGKKFALGHVFSDRHVARPEEGVRSTEADQVLDVLAAHPSTARFLAKKLVRWFLTPTPPAELVDRVAQAYLDTQGDIKAMLRVVLAKENFRVSSPVLAPKFRRPFHYVVSLLRLLDAKVKFSLPNVPLSSEPITHVQEMGQLPYGRVTPDGYPDTVAAWGSALLPRWTFAADLLKNRLGGPAMGGVFLIDSPELRARLGFATDPDDRPGLARRMNDSFFGSTLGPREVDELQAFIRDYPGTFDDAALFDALCLGASLPGFQWY
jgi:hypothetical protein